MVGPLEVLHITAHLGGGVGRVLSEVVRHRRKVGSPVVDRFAVLEAPENTRFYDTLVDCGAEVVIAPDAARLEAMIAEADIVQLEWWHHPLTAAWLGGPLPADIRLVLWIHSSGLHYPAIPEVLVREPHAVMPTTVATLLVLEPARAAARGVVQPVSSCGGFDDFPVPERSWSGPIRFGYLGSFNYAKLHPRVGDFLDAADEAGFVVNFWGNPYDNPALSGASQCIAMCGFTNQPAQVLSELDVMVYLLNPSHYGSTENALLEAMACGVVPIVLDNPVETGIVEDGVTGLVVTCPQSFAAAVARLQNDRDLLRRLSINAVDYIRRVYSIGGTMASLDRVYADVMSQPRRSYDFAGSLGSAPWQWFVAGMGEYRDCFSPEATAAQRRRHPFLYEHSKSSVFHYQRMFPDDPVLARWVAMLEDDLALAEV